MKRELAVLAIICILLGTGIASIDNQHVPSAFPSPGTRAAPPISINSNITDNTTWDDVLYPYIYIRANIWVLENVILTILPGVTVRFDPGTSLHIKGGIIADGKPFYNITFIPYSSNPAPMSWQGISLENSTGPCVFDNVAIRYSEFGIACWGGETSITNSSIEYTHYFGILTGENSSVKIRKNYINFTTWAGIITGNQSTPVVEDNIIRTSNYGLVCYDQAEIRNNYIELCWLGILAWGDANIVQNQVRDCMDGIHAFFSSPLIENNLIVSCDGNGTRFMSSNAIVRDNTLVYNNVGMDIDYESKHLLATMQNNMVNGIDILTCFFVGKKDLVIDGVFIDSGWSKKYYGSLTAQGSVTLYDCRNVTIRDSTIINTVNSIFATNSTFVIYNSVFDNAARSQIYLEANATGTAFNRSVDPNSVLIGGDNCLFQTLDELQVMVEDFNGTPILGARVLVKESQLVLHDRTTDINGLTGTLIVKDRTVSDSGVIASPLSVEVIAAGYNFAPNPKTGVYVNSTGFVKFTDLGDIFPPTVQAVSVVDGDREFSTNGTITVSFSEPMNRTSVESAFSISGNITGSFSWDGNNMTFTPANLAPSTYYTVTISTGAMDVWNNSLEAPISFSFTTQSIGDSGGSSSLLVIIIAIFAIAGIAGWLILRKLKR